MLCRDQGVNGPAHDVRPLVVAMTDDGTERFLGNDFRKDHVVARLVEGGASGGQTGSVRRIGVATVGEVVLARFLVGLDRHRLVADLVGAEEVGQVQLGGRAGLDAHRGAVQFLGALDALGLADDEALAVIVGGVDEVQLDVDVADEGPRGVTEDDVAFLGVQQRETGLAGGGDELDLFPVAENRGRNRTAHVGVEALPAAGFVGVRKPRQAGIDDAVEDSTGLDVIQRAGFRGRGPKSQRRRRDGGKRNSCFFHKNWLPGKR